MNKPRFSEYRRPERLSEYPEATCAPAGQLVTKNAGWRNRKPVVDTDQCVGCLRCYMYCPDGVIYETEGKAAVDYDFCKGCGICAKQCPCRAIEMEAEG